MNKRIRKKKAKYFLNWFVKEKVPLAFETEKDAMEWAAYMARVHVGQKSKYQPKIVE